MEDWTYLPSKYVKASYRVYIIVVVVRVSHRGKIHGLKCKVCVSFGGEVKLGSKRKLTANAMSWMSPFLYENIKKYLLGKHQEKWKDYLRLSNDAKDTLFEGNLSFRNTLQYHFTGSPWGEHAIVLDLNKEIIEVLIG